MQKTIQNMQNICRICMSLCNGIFCIYKQSPIWWCRAHTQWPRSSREFQHPAGIELMSPYSLLSCVDHKTMSSPYPPSHWKTVYSQPWTNFLHSGLSFSECSKWISRPDKITRIFDRKPFIDTYYHIIHRLELNLHNFAQCSMLIKPPQTSENWKLEIQDRSSKFQIEWRYGWLTSNTANESFWEADYSKKSSSIQSLPDELQGLKLGVKLELCLQTNQL